MSKCFWLIANYCKCKELLELNKLQRLTLLALSGLMQTTSTAGIEFLLNINRVELDSADKEKTAFSTGKGLYEFNVMPFGFCNAPATFEHLMEHILEGLIGEICLV